MSALVKQLRSRTIEDAAQIPLSVKVLLKKRKKEQKLWVWHIVIHCFTEKNNQLNKIIL